MSSPRQVSPLSSLVWNNAATGVNGQSGTLRSFSSPFVSVFGTVTGATTLTLMYSADGGTTWYAGPTKTLAGAGGFEWDITTGAEYLAIQSSANVTATAWISAK